MRAWIWLLGAGLGCDPKDGQEPADTESCAPRSWFVDEDADGFGVGEAHVSCAAPDGHTSQDGDCDDADPARHPGAGEVCDDTDNDCDGEVDNGASDALSWFADTDGDGFAGSVKTVFACSLPGHGFSSTAPDCDDTNASVFPGADEVCDGADNDCNGSTDEDSAIDAPTWYVDADRDGQGGAESTTACTQPSGYADNNDDCDDADITRYLGALEVCDEQDNDCDGLVDEGLALSTWYRDADGDGYGDRDDTTEACAQPSGYTAVELDCDDGDRAISPGAVESCDEVDNDCNGDIDDGVASTFYADTDGDGYGDPGSTAEACAAPSGYTSDDSDCDDGSADVYPGADEPCYCDDGSDNDGDGLIDCEDGDCAADGACVELDCSDLDDGDNDGLTDCQDEDCWGTEECGELRAIATVQGGSGRVVKYTARRQGPDDYFLEFSRGSRLATFSSVSGTVRFPADGRSWASATSWSTCRWSVAQIQMSYLMSTSFSFCMGNSVSRSGVSLEDGCALSTSGFLPDDLHLAEDGVFLRTGPYSGIFDVGCDESGLRWYAGTTSATTQRSSGTYGSARSSTVRWVNQTETRTIELSEQYSHYWFE